MKTLITCHSNADCDAFAAMVASSHLYPGAKLLFPGTQEAGLASVYAGLDKEKYGFIDFADLDWQDFDHLVIVDTRQGSRLKHVEPLLKRDNLKIEVWDHHPPSVDDLEKARLRQASTGAVTSLFCRELQKRNVRLSP